VKFIIPILEDQSKSSKERSGIFLVEGFKDCREDLEGIIKELPLPIKTKEVKDDSKLLQDLTNQLFDVLYVSFTLLDRLEDVQRGMIKTGERNLIKDIYDVNWRIKKIVEVEVG